GRHGGCAAPGGPPECVRQRPDGGRPDHPARRRRRCEPGAVCPAGPLRRGPLRRVGARPPAPGGGACGAAGPRRP
ncbi:MAG: hypothetical protein AVDCRST_MAG57-3077, partial [uncultured Blastococcus sp.]